MRTRLVIASLLLSAGCTCGGPRLIPGQDASFDASVDASVIPDAGPPDVGPPPDRGPLDPDAACASDTAEAIIERLPVDIIWMVDNSTSMRPAIEEVQEGLEDFAALVESRDLDYRVIMLSLRGRGLTTSGEYYQVCIPPPLSGDTNCGDGPRFFHVSVNMRSTQLIEQFLGTLAQTSGYAEGDSRGSAPWRHLLREEATKTIVVVTDDNARTCAMPAGGRSCTASEPPLTATSLEDFPGGGNPFNDNVLGPGILTPEYGDLFAGYTFSAIYGWSDVPGMPCSYSDGSAAESDGPTYTTLVTRTGGVRARICDGPTAWGPFFEDVATAVERASRIDCNITIPEPPEGQFFEHDRINVFVDLGEGSVRVGKVSDAGACDERGGWYYDDEVAPTAVVLCPATCESVQAAPGETRRVEVQFGCQTIPI